MRTVLLPICPPQETASPNLAPSCPSACLKGGAGFSSTETGPGREPQPLPPGTPGEARTTARCSAAEPTSWYVTQALSRPEFHGCLGKATGLKEKPRQQRLSWRVDRECQRRGGRWVGGRRAGVGRDMEVNAWQPPFKNSLKG